MSWTKALEHSAVNLYNPGPLVCSTYPHTYGQAHTHTEARAHAHAHTHAQAHLLVRVHGHGHTRAPSQPTRRVAASFRGCVLRSWGRCPRVCRRKCAWSSRWARCSSMLLPAAMAPGRANGLYVVVVGEGECGPFLRGRSEQPSIPSSESASTGGYEKVGLHHISGLPWVCTRESVASGIQVAIPTYSYIPCSIWS